MTVLWKFKALIRSDDAAFYLDEQVPFVGDYRQAKVQAKERQTRWQRQNGRLIDHVEPSFCILPDKQQIPVSLLKLVGYALVGAIALTYTEEHTSHTIIAFEKNGMRQTDTIQSECFQTADNTVNDYMADARQKQRYDICAVAYNGVVIKENTMAKAFISRMYGPELGDNCFVFQTFRPGSRMVPIAFTGDAKLNLGNHIFKQRAAWFDILMEGFCQDPEAYSQWEHIGNSLVQFITNC